MKTTLTLLTALLLTSSAFAHKVKAEPRVQIAILLDTSSSMSGLIEQTKTQLWKIVNTFTETKRHGKAPRVEVALYEYGNSGLKPSGNFIRRIQPLTRDLDQISQDLFSLKTNGGDEYCGAVIQCAVDDLTWDTSSDVYKAIFIAGNEPFTQGPIAVNSACKNAIEHGIIINTIHCGSHQAGISGGWEIGAKLAEGSFTVINQDAAVAHIAAPQDTAITKLNTALNLTYVPYGKKGAVKHRDQASNDLAAAKYEKSGAAVQRAILKSTANYWNGNWDLVDASQAKGFDWSQLKTEDLPAKMKSMNNDEQKAYIAGKRAERVKLQQEIQRLTNERNKFVAEARARQADDEVNTLDEVITTAILKQMAEKGYQVTPQP